jgi:hypothetical protein
MWRKSVNSYSAKYHVPCGLKWLVIIKDKRRSDLSLPNHTIKPSFIGSVSYIFIFRMEEIDPVTDFV